MTDARNGQKPSRFSDNLQKFDVEELIAMAEELFIRAGRAKARAAALDEKRKRVKATLFVGYRNYGKSAADSEQLAYQDSRYQEIVDELETASIEAETSKARAEACRMKFEAWRTVEASQRAAMHL